MGSDRQHHERCNQPAGCYQWDTDDHVPCTVAVSTALNQGVPAAPYVNDVNTAIFAGSSSDNRPGNVVSETRRIFVVGQRTSQLATAGSYAGVRHYSRSLQAFTQHYGLITCGSSTAAFEFKTANIPLGQTYGDPWLSDPIQSRRSTLARMDRWADTRVVHRSFNRRTGVRIGLRGNDPSYWPKLAFGSAFNQGPDPLRHRWTLDFTVQCCARFQQHHGGQQPGAVDLAPSALG